jgi:hypothetical protein
MKLVLAAALLAASVTSASAENMPSTQDIYNTIQRDNPQPQPPAYPPLRPSDIPPVNQNVAPPAMQTPASQPAWRPSPYDSLLK